MSCYTNKCGCNNSNSVPFLSNALLKEMVFKEMSFQFYNFEEGITYKNRVDKKVEAFAKFIEGGPDEIIEREIAGQFNTLNHHLGYLNAIDKLVTQDSGVVTVNGHTRKTMAQIENDAADSIYDLGEEFRATNKESIEAAIGQIGFVTIDSFELGATITQRNQALRHTTDGKLYRWAGDLPKIVPASSTPNNSGGLDANAWLEVSDTALRQELAVSGAEIVGVGNGLTQDNINRGVESINDLLVINNPKDGLRVYVKSYHAGLGKGGGEFVFDESKSTINNEGTIINGWVRQTNVFSVQDFGARADGVSDDSMSIRKAIEAMPRENSVLLFPAGVYIQGDGSNPHYTPNSTGGYGGSIAIGEPIYFFFENFINFRIEGYGAVIKAHPDNSCIANNRGFEFKHCKNGVISGLTYDGQIESRKPWGRDVLGYNNQSAFFVNGSSYLTFTDVTAEGSVMDGFYLHGTGRTYDTYANHITLNNCKAYRSYRQGMTVVNGHYGRCVNCVFSETGTIYGTSPSFGVDMEEGYLLDYVDRGQSNWLFDNCLFEDNKGQGLGLHWGSHNCTVTASKFINNGIYCPEDSEYLTVDNNIINNYFENTTSTLIGGGVLVKDNKFVDSNLVVGSSKKSYELGVSRLNKIESNTFYWSWSVTPETLLYGDTVDEQRRIVLGSSEVDIIDNLLVNPSGRYIIYCNRGNINKYIGNTIKSNIDPKPYANYLGDLFYLNARYSENNTVLGEYKVYSESGQISYSNSNTAKISTYEVMHFFNNSGNDRFDVEICPWDRINSVKNVELTTNGNNSELFTYVAGSVSSQERLRQKLYGDNSLVFKYSSIYQKDGKAVITVYPVGLNAIFLEVKVLATVSIDPERMGLKIVKYKVDNPTDENLVFKQRLMEGTFTVLPTEDDYIIIRGDSIFYNNKPIWYIGNNVWVDATGQDINEPVEGGV